MNRFIRTSLVLGLMLASYSVVHAQQPGQYPTQQVIVLNEQGKPEQAPAPVVVVAPECKTTICVVEPKKNTKVVYGSRCKDFCIMSCSLFGGHGGGCDSCGDCGLCGNCEKRTKNVL